MHDPYYFTHVVFFRGAHAIAHRKVKLYRRAQYYLRDRLAIGR